MAGGAVRRGAWPAGDDRKCAALARAPRVAPRQGPAAAVRRGVAALLACGLLLLASAVPAAAASVTVLAVRMSDAANGDGFLVARGGSEEQDPFGEFEMTGRVSRIPCPGAYVLQMATENQDTGVASSYRASVGLTPWPTSPQAPRCGEQVPPRPGTDPSRSTASANPPAPASSARSCSTRSRSAPRAWPSRRRWKRAAGGGRSTTGWRSKTPSTKPRA